MWTKINTIKTLISLIYSFFILNLNMNNEGNVDEMPLPLIHRTNTSNLFWPDEYMLRKDEYLYLGKKRAFNEENVEYNQLKNEKDEQMPIITTKELLDY